MPAKPPALFPVIKQSVTSLSKINIFDEFVFPLTSPTKPPEPQPVAFDIRDSFSTLLLRIATCPFTSRHPTIPEAQLLPSILLLFVFEPDTVQPVIVAGVFK